MISIPEHKLNVRQVCINLRPTHQVYRGAIRYGDYYHCGQKSWWVFNVNSMGIITLRYDPNSRPPQHDEVTEAQLRTCFHLTKQRPGGRIAFSPIPKEAKA